MRTPEEIQEAIAKLKKNREQCVPYDGFGNDNRRMIDVIVRVLQEEISFADIDRLQPPASEAAEGALDYLDGNCEIDALLYPLQSIYLDPDIMKGKG